MNCFFLSIISIAIDEFMSKAMVLTILAQNEHWYCPEVSLI